MPRPLIDRKARLAALLANATSPLQYCDHQIGRGREFHKQACGMALEGIVSKRADAPYTPGNRGLWRKVKCLLTRYRRSNLASSSGESSELSTALTYPFLKSVFAPLVLYLATGRESSRSSSLHTSESKKFRCLSRAGRHKDAPLGRADGAATPSSMDRIGRFGITTR
jgi:hypothetical protein